MSNDEVPAKYSEVDCLTHKNILLLKHSVHWYRIMPCIVYANENSS